MLSRMQRKAGVSVMVALALMMVTQLQRPTAAQDRQIGGVGLSVFADPEFRGDSATFRDDVPDLRAFRLNDQITSVRVGRGETWEVCENVNYAGRCQIVSGDEADLRRVGWSDSISSARRVRGGRGAFPNAGGRRSGIELFSEPGFRGARRTFDEAVPNLSSEGFNDQAMSVRLAPREEWEICADANYRNCRVIGASSPNLSDLGMSTRISSLRPSTQGDRGDGGFGRGRPQGREGRLVLYDQRNFRGQSVVVEDVTGDFGRFSGRAESVQVEGGTWEVCTGADFRGRCILVSESANDLGQLGLRNNVGSARPVRTAGPRR